MTPKRIVATIEARMTSSRLPGKVMLSVMGKPMIEHLVNRLRRSPSVQHIVLATTTNATDDVLEEFAIKNKIDIFRGSEEDVMSRVIGAAEHADAETIVEITGDCPVIDPEIVEQCVRMFHHNECDYLSNAHVRSYPDGMDVQVFKLQTLKKSASLTQNPLEHEHVTLHIRNHPELFRTVHLVAPPNLHWPELGLTLDDQTDYELLKKIMEHFGPSHFSCDDILVLLRKNLDWVKINQHVLRKGDT